MDQMANSVTTPRREANTDIFENSMTSYIIPALYFDSSSRMRMSSEQVITAWKMNFRPTHRLIELVRNLVSMAVIAKWNIKTVMDVFSRPNNLW